MHSPSDHPCHVCMLSLDMAATIAAALVARDPSLTERDFPIVAGRSLALMHEIMHQHAQWVRANPEESSHGE